MASHKRKSVPVQPAQCAAQHEAIMAQVRGLIAVETPWQSAVDKSLQAGTRWMECADKKLDDIALGLKAVMSIKVNGTEPLEGEFPLQTSLRGLHEIVHPEQVRKDFWENFREYRKQSWFFQIFTSKLVRSAIVILVFMLINTIAKRLNIPLTFDVFLKLIGMGG